MRLQFAREALATFSTMSPRRCRDVNESRRNNEEIFEARSAGAARRAPADARLSCGRVGAAVELLLLEFSGAEAGGAAAVGVVSEPCN
eukprot:gene6262-1459_t